MYVFACIDKEHLWKNIQGTSATHHLCAGTCHWGTKMMDGLFTLGPFVPSDFKICNYITRWLQNMWPYYRTIICRRHDFFLHGFVDLFLAVLGRRCHVWAFSSCGKDRLLFSCGGFSCCRAWAQECRLSRRGAQGSQGTQGSSRTRNWTGVLGIVMWILNHWTTREAWHDSIHKKP